MDRVNILVMLRRWSATPKCDIRFAHIAICSSVGTVDDSDSKSDDLGHASSNLASSTTIARAIELGRRAQRTMERSLLASRLNRIA